MVDVACVVGGEGVCLPSVSDWGCDVGRHWRLLVTITPLLRSMCGSGTLCCLTGTWCC